MELIFLVTMAKCPWLHPWCWYSK